MLYDHTSSITFLEVEIFKDSNNSLACKLHRKPTSGNTILHSDSFHPRPLINSIPFSQFLRIKLNCSNNDGFLREARALKNRLLDRGYSHRCLKRAFNKANNRDRQDLLRSQNKSTPSTNSYTRVITTFSNELTQLRQILTKYWHVLTYDPIVGPFVSPNPLVTFRRNTSVGDRLVKSEFKGLTRGDPCNTLGTVPCGYCRYINTDKNPRLPNGWIFSPKTLCQLPDHICGVFTTM